MDKQTKIAVTFEGLLAGERYLRERTDEFDDGTSEGAHVRFVLALVSSVFDACRIAIEMPSAQPCKHPKTAESET